MTASGEPPAQDETSVLATLDLMAGHVVEAHALLAGFAPGAYPGLRVALDAVLFEIGRGLAAELPAMLTED